MNSPAINRIDPLTSLRFFAAAAIVVAHSEHYFYAAHVFNSAIHIELRQGVTFFFVLSGFILTVIYSGEDFSQRSAFFKFMRKRVARLWPLHITTAMINAILVPASSLITSWAALGILLTNILMLQSIVPLKVFYLSFNKVSWSISTEFFFYLSLPLLLLLARRSLWLPLIAVLPIFAVVITIGNLMNLPVGYPNNPDGLTHLGLVYINPLVRVFDFAVGVVTAKVFLKRAHQWKLANWQATLLELLSILLCLAILYVSPGIANSLVSFVGEGGKLWLVRSGFSLIGFSLLILIFAMQRGAISKFISAPHWVLLGDISYAMYLCHMSIFMFYSKALPGHRSPLDWILCLSFILILSHLLYTLIETPFRRIILARERKSLIDLQYARRLISSWKSQKIRARTVILASECLCLVGLAVFVVAQQPATKVLSASKANQIPERARRTQAGEPRHFALFGNQPREEH